ncbi:hypothetical protein [Chitinophaga pinensis]|uniref:Uncharacterized protein n=1 Tax=Chitinophaga pinensis (strain ATCC 43595 / DSM 2588 / LMG 13176 / NBRC 15968 / NCIMB 11800 / UQM 2034) TaxID=485918 RepID=A0A979GA15_CHIPD|nr:hypothetical protein [Chitinophaga pinensis]ACU63571.1 hypothetical protein Cpin_6163 [Chitinophaga pinensis DSM 2588]
MVKSLFLVLLAVCLYPVFLFGRTDSLPGKYFSLGAKRAGICFGNAPVYTGFRFNLINKNVKQTNILDVCFFSLGEDSLHTSNGLSLMLTGGAQHKSNGLMIAPVGVGINIENGVALTGLLNAFDKLNGYGLGFMMFGGTLNGLGTAFLIMRRTPADTIGGRINGMAVGVFRIDVGEVRGVSVAFLNNTKAHSGFAIGGYNKTNKLKGVQLGLYNVALNNPRGFRRLPLLNMHFGK